MEPAQIITWCGEKQIEPKQAIVLSGVPLNVTDDVLYSVLDGSKRFGRCKIRGQREEHAGKSQFVLIETTNDMTAPDIPERLEDGDLGSWLVNVSETKSIPVLLENRSNFCIGTPEPIQKISIFTN